MSADHIENYRVFENLVSKGYSFKELATFARARELDVYVDDGYEHDFCNKFKSNV